MDGKNSASNLTALDPVPAPTFQHVLCPSHLDTPGLMSSSQRLWEAAVFCPIAQLERLRPESHLLKMTL